MGLYIDALLEKMPSKYAITMAVAERAKQLEGTKRALSEYHGQKPLTAAIADITQDKVVIEVREADEEPEEEIVGLPEIESAETTEEEPAEK